jgi:hypothetical protein
MTIGNRDDELRNFKANIDLVDFAISYGYAIDKEKSTKREVVMRHDAHDKIVVAKAEDGHWVYWSVHSERNRGTVIDLVQSIENCNMGEARKILRRWSGLSPEASQRTYVAEKSSAPLKSSAEILAYLKRYKLLTESEYLTNRGIDTATLNDPVFAGQIIKGYQGAVIFPHRDIDGICGYEIKKDGFTGFAENAKKSFWRSNIPAQVDSITVVESGIEALSHYQANKPTNTLYISTSGNWRKDVDPLLQAIIKKYQTLNPDLVIRAAFNNDSGGDMQVSRLKAIAQQVEFQNVLIDQPAARGEDWNDVVRDIKKKHVNQQVMTNERVLVRQ